MRSWLLKKQWYMDLEVAMLTPVMKLVYIGRKFSSDGKQIPYLIHKYNATYSNERLIEIAIAHDMLNNAKSNPGKTLEIGNVYCHYFPITHDVLDKFEKHPLVTHQKDILTFKPAGKAKYDTVFSLSTLEHVGFDEQGKSTQNPQKIIASLKNILSWTNKYFMFTFPLGFNKKLDKIVLDGTLTKKFGIKFRYFQKVEPLKLSWVEKKSMPLQEYDFAKQILVVCEWKKKK